MIPDGTFIICRSKRANRESPPLAARYQVVVAPSATLWRQWRVAAPHAASRRALTLADPDLAFSPAANAPARNASLQQGLRLGRLPHARQESRALERHLGNVEVLMGARASEKGLKERDLRQYDILHLAAMPFPTRPIPSARRSSSRPAPTTKTGFLGPGDRRARPRGSYCRALGLPHRFGGRA